MPKPSITTQDRLIDDAVCFTGDVTDDLVQIMARLNRSHAALITTLDDVEVARRLVRAAAANAHNLGPVHTALRKLRMVAPGGRVQALRETAAAVA